VPTANTESIQRWSTADVPPAKRLDYFAAALSEAVYPLGIDNADTSDFSAEVSFAHLDCIGVCKTQGSPHGAFRGRGELARTRGHSFNLLMTLQSPWTAEHRGSLRMLPRDVLILDSQDPLRTDVPHAFIAVSVAVSEAWLRRWLPDPRVLAARRIPGESLWGLALSSYLGELSPDLVAAPPLPLSVLADQVGSLLALTASGMRQATESRPPALRSLRDRIHECISQRCTEAHLTAVDVAVALGISVRTLHRTLTVAHESFGASLVDARARVAVRMLTSPLFRRVTTAEIGRRAGFLSASHFARVVRKRTGLAPLQLRRAAHDEMDDEPTSED
jgi:AraC-like DNA-binding protein